jgi:hypothetical protein
LESFIRLSDGSGFSGDSFGRRGFSSSEVGDTTTEVKLVGSINYFKLMLDIADCCNFLVSLRFELLS